MAEKFSEAIAAFGPRLVAAALIVVVGYYLARLLRRLVLRSLGRSNVDPTLSRFTSNLVFGASLALVGISALGKLGVATTSFAALLGASALAVGLALQDSLGNFAAGVMLMLFRPFQSGDYVEVAGISGQVQEVQIFATTLTSPDNKEITVPNGAITSANIVNYTARDQRRVDLLFGIGYADDISAAKQIVEQVLRSDSRVLSDPAPVIAVSELADSSVNLVARPWVKTDDYWGAYFDLTERVKLAFDERGISIPFPQTDVHLHQIAPAGSA